MAFAKQGRALGCALGGKAKIIGEPEDKHLENVLHGRKFRVEKRGKNS